MLPILWSYILRNYFKGLFFCLSSFIAILIVSRFKEIGKFMALSGDLAKTGLFALYQIPPILPLAIPCSALVSSVLLLQNMSQSQELTTMRASGFSLKKTLAPLIGASFFLSLISFLFCANISPACTEASKEFFYKKTSKNPLILLQRQNLIKMKTSYLKMRVEKEGAELHDFILITPLSSTERLTLFTAKTLKIEENLLKGKYGTLIGHARQEGTAGFDLLLLENQERFHAKASDFSSLLKKQIDKAHPATLNFQTLLFNSSLGHQKSQIEVLRRCSLPLAVITFTLLGAAFGMETGRNSSMKRWGILTLLVLPALISFLSLKALKTNVIMAAFSSFTPHLIILGAALRRLRSISKGTIS
jgi:lipopolysaccharide export system permease protein